MGRIKSNLRCNKPVKSWRPGKKRAVLACSRGKEKIVHYGATGYGNNYSAAARRSFRARHKCDQAKDKLSARYWACQDLWVKGGARTACPPGRRCKLDKPTRRSRRRKSKRSSRKRSRKRKSRRKSRRRSRKRKSRKKSRRRSRKKSKRRKSRRKSRRKRSRR